MSQSIIALITPPGLPKQTFVSTWWISSRNWSSWYSLLTFPSPREALHFHLHHCVTMQVFIPTNWPGQGRVRTGIYCCKQKLLMPMLLWKKPNTLNTLHLEFTQCSSVTYTTKLGSTIPPTLNIFHFQFIPYPRFHSHLVLMLLKLSGCPLQQWCFILQPSKFNSYLPPKRQPTPITTHSDLYFLGIH